MALGGHNRGKKWVPGEGYRYPEVKTKPVRQIKCAVCGQPVVEGQAQITRTLPGFTAMQPKTETLHLSCV